MDVRRNSLTILKLSDRFGHLQEIVSTFPQIIGKLGMRKIIAVYFLIFLLSLSSRADEFKLPALIGQTGASSTFGKVELEGYTLAVEEWNAKHGGIDGKPVRLDVDDTRTNQNSILSGFHKFAAEGHKVILGPTWLDAMQGVIPVAKTKGVLLVTPSAEYRAFTSENSWPITLYYNSESEARALVDHLASTNLKKVSVLYEQEPFAELFSRLVAEEGKDKVEFVDTVSVSAGETNFKALLPRLMSNKPEAFIILVWDESSLLALLKDLKRFTNATPLLTIHDGEGWLTKPDFKAEISQLTYPRFRIFDADFKNRFVKRFGHEVTLTGSNAYDAAWSVLSALKEGNRDAAAIRKFVTSTTLQTVTFGPINLKNEGRVTVSSVEMVKFVK